MNQEKLLQEIKEFFKLDRVLFLDFETFYKTRANKGTPSFSLSSRPYWDYIMHERYQTTGLGYAFDLDDFDYVHSTGDLLTLMDEVAGLRNEGEKIGVVAHNCQFDGSILNWVYGVEFDFYFCTQLMAKATNVHLSSSLKNLAIRTYPDDKSMRKGTELMNFDGVLYEDFTDEMHKAMKGYCVQDCELLRAIFFNQMEEKLPQGEIELIHITLRSCIEPQFMIDRVLLEEVIEEDEELTTKAVLEAIEFCHKHGVVEVAPKSFSSNNQYKALLSRFSVIVPTKISKTTFKATPALGKNDPEYIKMKIKFPQLHPLFKARDRIKSNIDRTRAQKMIECADLFYDQDTRFKEGADMPMFLKYYGAENTGRWSGGQKLNQQNLRRKSKHRLALGAQTGYLIGVNDLSQIELRVNLWFCDQTDLLDRFRTEPDFDMYSLLASDIYGFMVNKTEHKAERQVGKAGELGLGYTMSWYGFQQYLASGPLGMEPMFVTDDFAKKVKMSYEATHSRIKAMWTEINAYVLPTMVDGGEYRFGHKGCLLATRGKLILPSGRVLHYPNTRVEGEETQYGFRQNYLCDSSRYDRFGKPIVRYLHKGLIIENIIQALARDILAYQMLGVERSLQKNKLGWVIGSVHDEILAMLKASQADKAFSIVQYEMSKTPEWAEGIPLASEGGYADRYSK